MKEGDPVWFINACGERVPGVIREVLVAYEIETGVPGPWPYSGLMPWMARRYADGVEPRGEE